MREQRSRPSHLGRHTTLAYIIDQPHVWSRIPYLRENEGRAPPFVVAVGDRRRVHAFAKRLRKPVFLSETAARLCRKRTCKDLSLIPQFGRVEMAIGQLSSGAPVLVVETQMGAPATEIIVREMLSDELTDTNYQTGRTMTRLPHKVVIRVGTAGGINCNGLSTIRVGDVVNATHSIGVTGSMIQSLTRLDFWRPEAVAEFLNKWTELGSNFTLTETGHPRVECSEDVVEALHTAGRQVAGDFYHKGGNITKDSLYSELEVETFLDLCRAENCRSTEMELSAIALAVSGCDAHFGMVSSILGVLPGASFTGSETAKAKAESRSISVALEALNRLSIQS